MESNRNVTQPREQTHNPIGQTASAPSRARDDVSNVKEKANEIVDQTKQVVSNAYEQTTQALGNTYDHAIEYGRTNPGTAMLIAFGAGVGIGVLIASGMPASRSRMNRIAEPVVSALSQVALEFLR